MIFGRKGIFFWGFPGGWDSKGSANNAEDPGSIPESGRSPGEGHSNPFQYFCLENPMNRRACRATVHGVAKSQTRLKQLSTHTSTTQVWRRAGPSAPPTSPRPPPGADPCQSLSRASPSPFQSISWPCWPVLFWGKTEKHNERFPHQREAGAWVKHSQESRGPPELRCGWGPSCGHADFFAYKQIEPLI